MQQEIVDVLSTYFVRLFRQIYVEKVNALQKSDRDFESRLRSKKKVAAVTV